MYANAHPNKKTKNTMVLAKPAFLFFIQKSKPIAPKTTNEKAGIKRILFGIAVDTSGIDRLTKKREKKESITVARETKAAAAKKTVMEFFFLYKAKNENIKGAIPTNKMAS